VIRSLEPLHRRLERAPAALPGSFAAVLTAAVGAVDFLTGAELSASVFYALPVGLAAWYAGAAWGIGTCLLAAATWFGADAAAGAAYAAPWIPVWNAGVRLAFFVLIAELTRRLHDALDAQRRLAETDELTGLANTRRFQTVLDAEVRRAVRYGRSLTLAYVDLDGFKAINDRWGHAAGDRVLTRIGGLLRSHVRVSDMAGRLGGDEFAILLPETDGAQARDALGNLRTFLERAMREGSWPVGFSIGVVSSSGEIPTAQELLRTADGLMYEVKHAGKGTTRFLDAG
jgi:diguanylate cyclase (GGDEF)-like protein